MPGLLEGVDPDGLLEFSVVYSDRALNHMSKVSRFCPCRRSRLTCTVPILAAVRRGGRQRSRHVWMFFWCFSAC